MSRLSPPLLPDPDVPVGGTPMRTPWWAVYFRPEYAVLAFPKIGGVTHYDRVEGIGVYPWLWMAKLAYAAHCWLMKVGLHRIQATPLVAWDVVLAPRMNPSEAANLLAGLAEALREAGVPEEEIAELLDRAEAIAEPPSDATRPGDDTVL